MSHRGPNILIYWISFVAAVAGCDRENDKISTYRVSKDPMDGQSNLVELPSTQPHSQTTSAAPPPVQWTLPDDWKPAPNPPSQPGGMESMRFATIVVDDAPPPIPLTIIPLSSVPLGPQAGGIVGNIHRWEEEIQRPPTPDDQVPQLLQHMDVTGVSIDVVDLQGPSKRMLAAIAQRGEKVWFFKVIGATDRVALQRQKFQQFVNSLRFASASDAPVIAGLPTASTMPTSSVGPEGSIQGIVFTAPPDWQREPEKEMRAFSFIIPALDGNQKTTVELIATRLPPRSGTPLLNLNRWRKELKLPPVDDTSGLTPATSAISSEVGGLIDLAGNADDPLRRRLLVATIEHDGFIWYFKLIGPYSAVVDTKASFEAFLKSLRFAR